MDQINRDDRDNAAEQAEGIPRRSLLRGIAAAGVTAAVGAVGGLAQAKRVQAADKPMPVSKKWRGVNLGSWLVLEKWITPKVFEGVSDAGDEFTLCGKLGETAARARLRAHQDTFVTDDDFKWLAAHGINVVRIPVGYWTLKAPKPFISSEETLDRAFAQAAKYGIGVLLDLHGAPGSQNGWDHSGKSGELGWHKSKENIALTLDAIDQLSERYASRLNLVGVELLNEPRWDVPLDILKRYYTDGYQRVRRHTKNENVAVVIHDGFRPMDWAGFLGGPEYKNVILDTHMYQCYTDEDRKRDGAASIAFAAGGRRSQIDEMKKGQPQIIVGEWSTALDPKSYGGASPFERDTIKRGYGAAQVTSYEASNGWFYWTYKMEHPSDWSFRENVERGWLPPSFTDPATRG